MNNVETLAAVILFETVLVATESTALKSAGTKIIFCERNVVKPVPMRLLLGIR
ncbi:MAG: hypothetical protein R2827_15445 [Bdellovibrionales bacterium]